MHCKSLSIKASAKCINVNVSSHDHKRPACQVCIGEVFSKLAKYERDSGKWKMLTRNVATYGVITIPQRSRAADEELTRPLAWWRNGLSPSTQDI